MQTMPDEKITFTQTGVIRRNNKNAVCVRFERQGNAAKEFAEGFVPECKIVKSNGFTKEEIEKLEAYMLEEKPAIIEKAKEMSNFLKMWGNK